MAVHAGLRRRNVGDAGNLDRGVTVAAIETELADVELVAVGQAGRADSPRPYAHREKSTQTPATASTERCRLRWRPRGSLFHRPGRSAPTARTPRRWRPVPGRESAKALCDDDDDGTSTAPPRICRKKTSGSCRFRRISSTNDDKGQACCAVLTARFDRLTCLIRCGCYPDAASPARVRPWALPWASQVELPQPLELAPELSRSCASV